MKILIDKIESLNGNIEGLKSSIDGLDQKLGKLLMRNDRNLIVPNPSNSPLDVVTLLSLPDKLRKTAFALSELKEADAETVSKRTGRLRAVESNYLNQLFERGVLRKERKGHTVFFHVE